MREIGQVPDNFTNLQQFFEGAIKIHPDAPGSERLYLNFRDNIDAICRSGTAAGAQLVLCTLGDNLRDVSPFASLHRPGITEKELLTWEADFRAGCEAADPDSDAYDLEKVCFLFERAKEIDPDYAVLNYQLAQCLLRLGNNEAALKNFIRARDCDAFFVRADSRINETIRRTAEDWSTRGAHLADTEALFASASLNGIMGNDIFYDAVHVLFEGNYYIALSVFNIVAKQIATAKDTVRFSKALSLETCKQQLGLSPFLEVSHMKDALEELQKYQEFCSGMDSTFLEKRITETEATLDADARDHAIQSLESALPYWGDDFHIRKVIAMLLKGAGRDAEAQDTIEKIIQVYPEWPAAQNFKQLMEQQ